MAKVSVVIPAYNSANFIADAIDSVLAQTFMDFEIIVIDDGSSDNIDEVIASYDIPIVFIKQSNGGAAVARNAGMRKASGDYIAILDADDIWFPTKLEKQIDFLETEKDIGTLFCDGFRWVPPAPPLEGELLSVLRGELPSYPPLDLLFKIHLILTSSVVFRRCLVDYVGYMDKSLKYGEDYEYFLRLAAQKPVAYINQPLMAYRLCANNTSSYITHENVKRRLRAKLHARHVALKSVPKINNYFIIKLFAAMPDFLQYIMILYWRKKYGGSTRYLLDCLARYGKKLFPGK